MATHWDNDSGIRERLALLAALGPTIDPNRFGYDSSKDYWYTRGRQSVQAVSVRQEGSASLDLIAERWRMDRATAMAWIGHPERTA